MCTICIGSTIIAFVWGLKNRPEQTNPDITGAHGKLEVKKNTSESVKEKYMIKLDGEFILAYMQSDDGKYKLWNSVPASPDLSLEERKKLQDGIMVKDFEELCLYFEAYSS